jgi:hypothetical protein
MLGGVGQRGRRPARQAVETRQIGKRSRAVTGQRGFRIRTLGWGLAGIFLGAGLWHADPMGALRVPARSPAPAVDTSRDCSTLTLDRASGRTIAGPCPVFPAAVTAQFLSSPAAK